MRLSRISPFQRLNPERSALHGFGGHCGAGGRSSHARRRPGLPWRDWPGLLSGLSTMMRSIGVAVVAGILVAAFIRDAPFARQRHFAWGRHRFSRLRFGQQRLSLAEGGSSLSPVAVPGWRQTFLYDTSYLKMWRHVRAEFPRLLGHAADQPRPSRPGALCLFFVSDPQYWHGWPANASADSLDASPWQAWFARPAASEWKPIHFIFAFYLAVILLWNYPIMDRFPAPLPPLFHHGSVA